MGADDDRGRANPLVRARTDGGEPPGEDVGLVGDDLRRGTEIEQARAVVDPAGRYRLAQFLEEPIEVCCAEGEHPRCRDPVEVGSLACLERVPHEQQVRMLVQRCLAGEVVPAPNEHDRRDAEPAGDLEHVWLVTAEHAPSDDEDSVYVEVGDSPLELRLRWHGALELAERVAHASTHLGRQMVLHGALGDRSRLPVPCQLEHMTQCSPPWPAGVAEGRAEEADEVGQRPEDPDRVVVRPCAPQRKLDHRCKRVLGNGVGDRSRRGREDELRAGVEELKEELGQPLDRRRARDDE